MKQFTKISSGLDVNPAIGELERNSHLWGEINYRREGKGSPHFEMVDIWVRYGDILGMVKSGDYSRVADEHDSEWLHDLPAIRRICFDVMAMVDGERLGGVWLTKLPPGGVISPHIDGGWHAGYYDKYYVPIANEKGSVFCFEDGEIDPDVGDVWHFDNSKVHWVENNTPTERIALIICIKQSKYIRGDLCRQVG